MDGCDRILPNPKDHTPSAVGYPQAKYLLSFVYVVWKCDYKDVNSILGTEYVPSYASCGPCKGGEGEGEGRKGGGRGKGRKGGGRGKGKKGVGGGRGGRGVGGGRVG